MIGLFKRRSKIERLQKKYEALLSEWHELSSRDRRASDLKYSEAQKVLEQIEILRDGDK